MLTNLLCGKYYNSLIEFRNKQKAFRPPEGNDDFRKERERLIICLYYQIAGEEKLKREAEICFWLASNMNKGLRA